ncbi:MAG: hypothetical protein ACKVQJ_06565 [Pyrinomonadaceae bacterium]
MHQGSSKKIWFALTLVFFTSIPLLAQNKTTLSEPDGPVYLEEILRTFRFPKDSQITNKELNQRLITIIRSRRVSFLLDEKLIKQLKDAGASDDLLKTIDTSLTPREKEGIIDSLSVIEKKKAYIRESTVYYDKIRELFAKKDYESRKALIKIGEDFLEKYGNDEEQRETIAWLKMCLPKMRDAIRVRF